MALILNGTDQLLHKPKAAFNYQSGIWAQFAWVKRDVAETQGMIFGISRATSFERISGVFIRDSGGPVVSNAVATGGGLIYDGTTPSTTDWVPILRMQTVADAVNGPHTLIVDGVEFIGPARGYINDPDTIVIGAGYDQAVPQNFFTGEIAHWAEWRGVLPTATAIAELMAGTAPDSLSETAATDYEPLISGVGSFSATGSPTFNAEDPLASLPVPGVRLTLFDRDGVAIPDDTGYTVVIMSAVDSETILHETDTAAIVGGAIEVESATIGAIDSIVAVTIFKAGIDIDSDLNAFGYTTVLDLSV